MNKRPHPKEEKKPTPKGGGGSLACLRSSRPPATPMYLSADGFLTMSDTSEAMAVSPPASGEDEPDELEYLALKTDRRERHYGLMIRGQKAMEAGEYAEAVVKFHPALSIIKALRSVTNSSFDLGLPFKLCMAALVLSIKISRSCGVPGSSQHCEIVSQPVGLDKGCIGAIDGTLINAVIPIDKQIPYRGRGKGECTQNVMAACSFNMLFTYVLAGWEDTVHDSLILMDVVLDPKYKFPHAPPGKYYVVDAGYRLMQGFLTRLHRIEMFDIGCLTIVMFSLVTSRRPSIIVTHL